MALPKKPSGAAFRKQKRDRKRSDLDKQVAIKNWLLLSKSNLLLQPATNLVQNDPNSIQYDDSNSIQYGDLSSVHDGDSSSIQNDKLNLNNKANLPSKRTKMSCF